MKQPITNLLSVGIATLLLLNSHQALANPPTSVKLGHQSIVQLADADLPWTKGKVVKISQKRGIVTIAHEEISNLQMPSMTMGFMTKEKATLEDLKAGDMIEFQTEEQDGKLVLLHYRRPKS